MTTIRIRGIQRWQDKRHGDGTVRLYLRRDGFKPVPLPGPEGSPAFMAAYHAALKGDSRTRAVFDRLGTVAARHDCGPCRQLQGVGRLSGVRTVDVGELQFLA